MARLNQRQACEIAREVSSKIINDLNTNLRDFMEKEGLNIQQMASRYGFSVSELHNILNSNDRFSIQTAVKIFILSDKVIEVKNFRDVMQPHHNCQHHSHQMPPMPPMPPRGAMPPVGGFEPRYPRHDEARMQAPQDGWNEFDDDISDETNDEQDPINFNEGNGDAPDFRSMSRGELENIINEHLWSSEIDVEESTKHDLVAFLEKKEQMRQQNIERKRRAEEEGGDIEDLKDRLTEACKANPHLKVMVDRLIKRQ